MLTIRELAMRVAKCLFTSGGGERAERLVLEMPMGKSGGGWAENCMADQIAKCLVESMKPLTFHEETNGRIHWRQAITAFGKITVFDRAWQCGELGSGFCNGFHDGEERARCWYEEQISEIFKGSE